MSPQFRLAAYYALARRWPKDVITSADIGASLGVNPTQVRRDLSKLGRNGKRGTGYHPEALARAIDEWLERDWVAVKDEAVGLQRVANSVLLRWGLQR